MPEVQLPSDLAAADSYETVTSGGDGGVSTKGGQDDGDQVDIYVGLVFDGFPDYSNLTDVKFQFFQPPTFDTAARLIVYRPQSASNIDITVSATAAHSIGNESVPIQLAQCWFPGVAISNAKI